jgi:hypothetical protein
MKYLENKFQKGSAGCMFQTNVFAPPVHDIQHRIETVCEHERECLFYKTLPSCLHLKSLNSGVTIYEEPDLCEGIIYPTHRKKVINNFTIWILTKARSQFCSFGLFPWLDAHAVVL